MPVSLQAKLLRVLQENEVRKLGSTASRKIDVRVIAATHKNLKQAVIDGAFRQDLLYRLEVINIHVPALRERPEDVLELAHYFLQVGNRKHSKEIQGITEEAIQILLSHPWPGNVRELSNVIERAIVFAVGHQIKSEDLPAHLVQPVGQSIAKPQMTSSISVPLGTSLKDVEELLIRKTLEATSGDKNMTAKLLGINSRTIYRKLDKRPESER
jgi:transcriptional regulator with PAS, ATPase and Fis domain